MIKKYTLAFTLPLFLALIVILSAPISVGAAEKCNFSRNLDLGVDGEDVRCLQKYLNASGFTIAESGVGSPGGETTLFRDLTKKAVAKWQAANGLSPASGYFGPLSRSKYDQITSGITNAITKVENPVAADALQKQLAELQAKALSMNSNSNSTATPTPTSSSKSAADKIKLAIQALKDADNQIEDAEEDGLSIGNAEGDIENAKEDLFESVLAYFKGNYEDAIEYADDAYDNAMDAFEEAGGETDEDEIDEMIEEVEDQIDEAWIEIDEAEDNDEDTDKAEDLLEQAEDVLDDAKNALDDGDYDEAEELANEAEDLVDDAVDAIGESDDEKEDAKDAIDDAQDSLNDAWD
ncbi:MAG: hypothetical protein QG609_492, partial [Patescibacteria group bacterium]|nr:hypothetical protein [Patescibacteria group bacterium]